MTRGIRVDRENSKSRSVRTLTWCGGGRGWRRVGDSSRRRRGRWLRGGHVASVRGGLPVRGTGAWRLDAYVAESGRGRGCVHGHGGAGLVAESLGRRVVALRTGRVRGRVIKKTQVELVRGARAKRHVGRQLVGGRCAAKPRR